MSKEDFARMKCPACGCETYIRINKNRILYTYCPYGHHLKLTAQESRQAIPAISAGMAWNNGTIFLYPLTTKGKEQNGTEQQLDAGRRNNDNGSAVAGTDAKHAGNTGGWWDV